MCKGCNCEPCPPQCVTHYPHWVTKRAVELANDEAVKKGHVRFYREDMLGNAGYPALNVVANFVMKYEKRPVDPDLILAREASFLAAGCPGDEGLYRQGTYDRFASVKAALKAIKMVREGR